MFSVTKAEEEVLPIDELTFVEVDIEDLDEFDDDPVAERQYQFVIEEEEVILAGEPALREKAVEAFPERSEELKMKWFLDEECEDEWNEEEEEAPAKLFGISNVADNDAELRALLQDDSIDTILIRGTPQPGNTSTMSIGGLTVGLNSITINYDREVKLESYYAGGAFITTNSGPHFQFSNAATVSMTFKNVQLKCAAGSGGLAIGNALFDMIGENTIPGFSNVKEGHLEISISTGSMRMWGDAKISHRTGSQGGAIYMQSNGKLFMYENSVISDNEGKNGGAIYIQGNNSEINMYGNSTIRDNKIPLGFSGAGILINSGTLNMYGNSSITGNIAQGYFSDSTNSNGGGVRCSSSGAINLYNTAKITNNRATGGGGIHATDLNKVKAEIGVIFAGNIANRAYLDTSPGTVAAHNALIKTTAISLPTPPAGQFTISWNNYDINYTSGTLIVDPFATPVPTVEPTSEPTGQPTVEPTQTPTNTPTQTPTNMPTDIPTSIPTQTPTNMPTDIPTSIPTQTPTSVPTGIPTNTPTQIPTNTPTSIPTQIPTSIPTQTPTGMPTLIPTENPTELPTQVPTTNPSSVPTSVPTPIDWGETTTNGGDATDGDGNGEGKIVVDGVGSIDVSDLEDRYYDGTPQTPKPHIELEDGTVLVEGVDYTLEWQDNVEVGQAKCIVTFIGKYTGKSTITFKILPGLIKDDHFAYIKGYEDGGFRPINNMTRAETAVMFARLMANKMNVDYEVKGLFSDVGKVSDGYWFAKEVEYLAELGIINGYAEAGGGKYFDPFGPITRAEFAAIASRFENLEKSDSVSFSDVHQGFWAYDAIISAAAKGWVNGYEDGSFGPANKITRAEVVTLVNRVLERVYGGPLEGMIIPHDVSSSYWAYQDILEAMNAHDFEIRNEKEVWTNLRK